MNLFYIPNISFDTKFLPEAESKHCIRVLRMKENDKIYIVDGIGGFYEGIITVAHQKKCEFEIIDSKKEYNKRQYSLHIAIAPTKNNDRFEWFLEKCTELGIDEITPILCENSERKVIKDERLDRVIVAAMKQSLKAYKPKLNKITHFDDFIETNPNEETFIAHCEDGDKGFLGDIYQPQKNIIVCIGPEGDFSKKEIFKARDMGIKEISLGKNRLRTETAGIYACSIINMLNERI